MWGSRFLFRIYRLTIDSYPGPLQPWLGRSRYRSWMDRWTLVSFVPFFLFSLVLAVLPTRDLKCLFLGECHTCFLLVITTSVFTCLTFIYSFGFVLALAGTCWICLQLQFSPWMDLRVVFLTDVVHLPVKVSAFFKSKNLLIITKLEGWVNHGP